jgi:hypothetical protein
MSRSARFLVAALVAAAILLAVSLYLHLWGGIAMIVVAAAGIAWYRMQVSQAQDTERFFGDAGEDTRVTGLQGVSPSELPVDGANPGNGKREDAAR